MKTAALVFLVIPALALAACHSVPEGIPVAPEARPVAGDIIDAKAGERIVMEALLDRIRDDRAVYLGEQHDNDYHHAFQLEIVRGMHRQDSRLLIGMEMFQRPTQEAVDRFLAGQTNEAQFLRESEYFSRWQWDWRYYRPILLYAREHGIPVVALNSPREANRRVSRGGGLKALTPEDRKWVAAEISLDVEGHHDYFMEIMESHPMDPGFDKEAFYASQCLWEDTMAESVAKALERHPGHRIAVIVGGGHVRERFGVPLRAERRGATPYSILLGAVAGDEEEESTFAELFEKDLADFFFVTEAAPETPPSPRLGVEFVPGPPDRDLVVMKVIEGSLAGRAGLRAKDRLVALAGRKVETVEDLRILLALLDEPAGVIEVVRDGGSVKLPFTLEPPTP